MNLTKPIHLSTSVWGALAAVAGALTPVVMGLTGLTNADDQKAAVELIGQAVSLAGGVVALIGRIRATHRIG